MWLFISGARNRQMNPRSLSRSEERAIAPVTADCHDMDLHCHEPK
jgi:hypothetical protein